MDPFAQIGVAADEDVALDVTPHIEAAIAVSLDISLDGHPLAGDDGPALDAQLDGALSANEHVAIGSEIVLFDVGPVGDREFVERIRAKHGLSVGVPSIKSRSQRQTGVRQVVLVALIRDGRQHAV
jgi:hypothetical protein